MSSSIRRLSLAAAILAALLTPALAQEPQLSSDMRLLSVNGEGVIRARPDVAVLQLGVVSDAEDAKAALAANTEAMTKILDALRASGIESGDLQTSGFSVEPRYSNPPERPRPDQIWTPEIVGYTVRNTITLRIRDLATTGDILDQVVTLGANSISGPTFTVAAPETLEDAAREAAIRDARRKAELYARVAEVRLGPVQRLQDLGYFQPQPAMMERSMVQQDKAASAPAPIEGGEITFQAQVSMSWRLE